MPFEVEINEEIKEGAKIIIPLSMGKKECTGERLKALVRFGKKYNTTLLVADSLQRHNVESKEKALKMGEKFLENNFSTLKEAVLIDTVEKWHKYEDTCELKLVRWDMWPKIKKGAFELADSVIEKSSRYDIDELADSVMEESSQYNTDMKQLEITENGLDGFRKARYFVDNFKDEYRDLLETEQVLLDKLQNRTALSRKGHSLLQSMKEEARINSSVTSEESSINYQKEENKYLLTFSDFDYHLYPGLNRSQIKVYALFASTFKLPKHFSPHFVNVKPEVGIFAERKKRHANSLPFAMRMLATQFEMVMTTSEFSVDMKKTFLNHINILIASIQLEIDQEHSVDNKNINNNNSPQP